MNVSVRVIGERGVELSDTILIRLHHAAVLIREIIAIELDFA